MLLEFSIIGFSLASWDLIVSNWNFSMLPYWRGHNLLRNMEGDVCPAGLEALTRTIPLELT